MAQAEKSVARQGQSVVDTPSSQSEAIIISLLDKVSQNPDIAPETLERLYALHERMEREKARRAYFSAFPEMVEDLPVIKKRGHIKNKQGGNQSDYAKWEDIAIQINPILSKHGFSLSFRPVRSDDLVGVVSMLAHKDGHCEVTDPFPLPLDTSGSKNSVQAFGSSLSYGKRYGCGLLLPLAFQGEDDDGKVAGVKTLNDTQVQALQKLTKEAGLDEIEVCAVVEADTLAEIKMRDFNAIHARLRKRIELNKNGPEKTEDRAQ